jgi:hypothetical protein
MNQVAEKILSLGKQLMPDGRAFWVPPQRPGTGSIITDEAGEYVTDEDGEYVVTEDYTEGFGGWFERFLKAFGGDGANRTGTLERCYNDARSILDHILPLPNNDKFTDGTVNPADNDCNDFEELLGLIQWGVTSPATPTRLQRMAVIATKMRYPGTDAPRQAATYIQEQLQAAGFPVYVYENLAGVSPGDILGEPYGLAQYGTVEYGDTEYGSGTDDDGVSIIANHVEQSLDAGFVVAPNYHGTFFISGSPITAFADIPATQKEQFRQMILSLKPAHMAGYLFINYT